VPVYDALREAQMSQESGIIVSGVGTAAGTPDVAMIDCGVEVHAGSADRATADAAEAARRVLGALRDAGVVEEAVRTSSHTVEPQMDHRGDRPVVTGYRVSTIFTARLEDTERVGETIAAVAAAGGEHGVIHGLRFTLSDNSGLLETARAAAWQDALRRAEQLASLAGVVLGAVESIVEGQGEAPIPRQRMVMAAEVAGPPIMRGENTVTVSIRARFGWADS
jgi:uncharacterized protein